MEIITLPLLKVWDLADEKVVFSPNYTESDFDKEWQLVRDALRKDLQLEWKESCYGDADFALSDDRSNTWVQAGGIQNQKMLSPGLFDIVLKVLGMTPHSDKWGILVNIDLRTGLLRNKAKAGQILFKNNALYVAKDKRYDHDYVLKLLDI